MKKHAKQFSNPFNTVEDPNKVPGWPPVADPPSTGSTPPAQQPNAPQDAEYVYDNTKPSVYPAPSTPPAFPAHPQSSGPAPQPASAPVERIHVDAVGRYKDSGNDLKELPAMTLSTSQAAADRMAMLKTRVNELQSIREGYWRKQGYAVAAGATTAVLSLGVGVVAAGAAGIHQRNKLEQVKKSLRSVLTQINMVRFRFGDDPIVKRAEEKVRITEAVFSKDIHRDELSGDL